MRPNPPMSWDEFSQLLEGTNGNQDQQTQRQVFRMQSTNDTTVAPQDLMLQHGHDQRQSTQPPLLIQPNNVLPTGLYDSPDTVLPQQNTQDAGHAYHSYPADIPSASTYAFPAQHHTQPAGQPHLDDRDLSTVVANGTMPTQRSKGKQRQLDMPSSQPFDQMQYAGIEQPTYDDLPTVPDYDHGALPTVATDAMSNQLPLHDNQLSPLQEGWEAYVNQRFDDDNMLDMAMIAGGFPSPARDVPDAASDQFQRSELGTDISSPLDMTTGFHALIEDRAPPSLPPLRPANTPAQHPTKQIWIPVKVPPGFNNDIRLELSDTYTAPDNPADSLSPDGNVPHAVHAVMHHYEDLASPAVLSEPGNNMGMSLNLSTMVNLHGSDEQARRHAWSYIRGRMSRRGIKMTDSTMSDVCGGDGVPVCDRFVISVREPLIVQGGQGRLVQRDIVWVQKVSFAEHSL